tara:strand:+ start:3230 stop:4282 length:1053 start_codon:yes stop_codon:yes gene_type:complete
LSNSINSSKKISWENLISKFSGLGGIVENVNFYFGDYGNGLACDNPDKPIYIYIPEEFLIRYEDVEVNNQNLEIKKGFYSNEIVEWFNLYQKNFSWGRGTLKSLDYNEKSFKEMPNDLKNFLYKAGLLDFKLRHKGSWNDVLKRRYFESRAICYKRKKNLIFPILELLNHKSDSKYTYQHNEKGIYLSGDFHDEILVNYGLNSPISRFIGQGFASDEEFAFSIKLTYKIDNRMKIIIRRPLNLHSYKINEKYKVDKIVIHDDINTFIIPSMWLACKANNNLPKIAIQELINGYDELKNSINPLQFFDYVLNYNLFYYSKLLKYIESPNSEFNEEFRLAINKQINLLLYSR